MPDGPEHEILSITLNVAQLSAKKRNSANHERLMRLQKIDAEGDKKFLSTCFKEVSKLVVDHRPVFLS